MTLSVWPHVGSVIRCGHRQVAVIYHHKSRTQAHHTTSSPAAAPIERRSTHPFPPLLTLDLLLQLPAACWRTLAAAVAGVPCLLVLYEGCIGHRKSMSYHHTIAHHGCSLCWRRDEIGATHGQTIKPAASSSQPALVRSTGSVRQCMDRPVTRIHTHGPLDERSGN